MTQEKTKIFFTGATGYIGGSVLNRLLTLPDRSSFDITVLVRSPDKGKALEKEFGVRPLVGSNSDQDKLTKAASESDFVIAVANADDLDAAKAILRGLKQRHASTGKAPILIHTSGTGVIADSAGGEYEGKEIYSDLDVSHIESIPASAPHREVDIAVVAADEEGYVRTYIIIPSTIYGIASGPVFDAGLANPHSDQIPGAIRRSIDRGQAGVVGKGVNLWPNVHIDEVADLYRVVFDAVRKTPEKVGHGREGFYFGESGEYALIDAAQEIGRVLVNMGKASTPEPKAYTDAEIDKYYAGSKYIGSNSRCKGERGRQLGWVTTKTTKDMLASIGPETEALIKSGNLTVNVGNVY